MLQQSYKKYAIANSENQPKKGYILPFLSPTTDTNNRERLLGVYIYYRLSLGLMLGIMHWTELSKNVFGDIHPKLFTYISTFYITVCTLSLLFYWGKILKIQTSHLLSVLAFDFIVLVIMIYSSGNLSGGLGYLLLIPMAVGSVFLQGKTNIGLAAFATLLVLAMSLININTGIDNSREIFSAGITGVSLFITAFAFRSFSEKVQTSEHTAKKQTEQANYLQLISQRIVENMRTGIVVIDRDLQIQLINHAAAILLTVNNRFAGVTCIKPISQCLEQWKNDGIIPSQLNVILENNQSLKISFAALEDSSFPSLMLFVDDTQKLNQEAQQLKLASLGRLTASIAHEIRNPLGAISHASQLLDESESISSDDQSLLKIIYNNSQRINFIINNILEFSRRNGANPIVININQWITDFKTEYLQHHSGNIEVSSSQENIFAKVDPNHLYQIISNLTDNGLRYSNKNIQNESLQFNIDINSKDSRPYIEIIDFGKGIPNNDRDKIFEPFFTTEITGSGLGLYLCKELSEANQANLSYLYDDEKKRSIFTLKLSHPQRKIELE